MENYSDVFEKEEEVIKEITVEVNGSGRDSGLSSTTSPRLFDSAKKLSELESQLEEIVFLSHKELHDAKQKLEELRLLRFEEKSVLKNEINQLNEKVDEEEKNTFLLEDKIKALQAQKDKEAKRSAALEKEQTIGCQINMMQEQEIVRLEMKLREFEIERFSMTKQIDLQRRTLIEKDKQRLKQQSEIHALTEKMNQLEEANTLFKSENDDKYDKLRDTDNEIRTLKKNLFNVNRELENSKTEYSTTRLEMQQLKMSNSRLEELLSLEKETVKDLKEKIDEIQKKFFKQVEELQEREVDLQQELENTILKEVKLSEKYDSIEHLYHETRRENDEKHFEIKQCNERIKTLTQQFCNIEEEKGEAEYEFHELQAVLNQYILQDTVLSPRPVKEEGEMHRKISPVELNEYFETTSSKMTSLKFEVSDLSCQIKKEQSIMAEMNQTIAEVKTQLEKTRDNLMTTGKMKDALETQLSKAHSTIVAQERELSRYDEEVSYLKEVLKDFEKRSEQLENDVSAATNQTSANEILYKEEKRKLKTKIQELENKYKFLEHESKGQENMAKSEKSKLQQRLEDEVTCNRELKSEVQKLIDDNKNLAQRLIHLESYSDKLGSMLEQHQADNDKLKEKLHAESKHNRTISNEKNSEISILHEKMTDLNRSLKEKNERNNKLDYKVKLAKDDQKALEMKMKQLDQNNEELSQQIHILSEAQKNSENIIISKNNEINSLHKQFKEHSKNIDDLFNKIYVLEDEKMKLQNSLDQNEKRLKLKENLISELSQKTREAEDVQSELKDEIEKCKVERRQQENHLRDLNGENHGLQKSLHEANDENSRLEEQITDLRKTLAKTEDEKDKCLNDLSVLQNELKATQIGLKLDAERESNKQRKSFTDLKSHVSSLQEELNDEKRRRQRLEALYNKRDDQVSQLRSTFDQSLNTITNDTKNIKSILGKSLQKIDRQMGGFASDTDVTTETDADSCHGQAYQRNHKYSNSNSNKYLDLSNHRTKSLEKYVDTFGKEKARGYSTHSTPLQSYPTTARSPLATSSVLLSSKKPSSLDLDTDSYDRKKRTNKRLTR